MISIAGDLGTKKKKEGEEKRKKKKRATVGGRLSRQYINSAMKKNQNQREKSGYIGTTHLYRGGKKKNSKNNKNTGSFPRTGVRRQKRTQTGVATVVQKKKKNLGQKKGVKNRAPQGQLFWEKKKIQIESDRAFEHEKNRRRGNPSK